MSNIKDGGPAFPVTRHHLTGDKESGMSLRHYYAGKALSGLLADPEQTNLRDVVIAAVETADLLIAELEKGNQ